MTNQNSKKQQELEDAIKGVQKSFGKSSIMKLDENRTLNIEGIHSGSLNLDIALGGKGIPRGRIIELFGAESSGKSTLCLHMIAGVQQQGGNVAFIDAEHAIDPEWAQTLGVDIGSIAFSQPSTGEEALQIVDYLVSLGCFDLIVVDSVAALVPKQELEGEIGDAHVGLQARMMGQAMRKLTHGVAATKTTVVFVNQIREKIGVQFGSPETTPGGRALKFYSSCRIKLNKIATLKEGDEASGIRVRAQVVKNKIAAPFKKAEYDLIPDGGINPVAELIDLAVANHVLKKSGGWYSFEGVTLANGKDNVRRVLDGDSDLKTEIQERTMKACGISYSKVSNEEIEGTDSK